MKETSLQKFEKEAPTVLERIMKTLQKALKPTTLEVRADTAIYNILYG